MHVQISATSWSKTLLLVLSLGAATASLAQSPQQTAAAVVSPTPIPQIAARKAGATCIGIPLPKVQLAQGDPGQPTAAESLRTTEVQYMQGPGVDIVSMKAMIPMQLAAEVKERDCELILYSNLADKTPAAPGSMFKKAMPFAQMIPMAGMLGGMTGAVTTSAAAVALNGAGGLAQNVKAKTEMVLTYRLVRMTDGVESPVLENTLHAKATRDGEDIISPMIEQVATAVISKVSVKATK